MNLKVKVNAQSSSIYLIFSISPGLMALVGSIRKRGTKKSCSQWWSIFLRVSPPEKKSYKSDLLVADEIKCQDLPDSRGSKGCLYICGI